MAFYIYTNKYLRRSNEKQLRFRQVVDNLLLSSHHNLLIIRMSCYSYKFEDEIRFGIFHEFDIDTWKVNPLILGQEASNIPDVVLDLRQQEVYVSKDTNIMEIYVVHEKWFTQNYLLYRDGMTNVYRINYVLNVDTSFDPIDESSFPMSNITQFIVSHQDPFNQELSRLDYLYQLYMFRNNLSEHITQALIRSKGKKNKIAVNMMIAMDVVKQLFYYSIES